MRKFNLMFQHNNRLENCRLEMKINLENDTIEVDVSDEIPLEEAEKIILRRLEKRQIWVDKRGISS